ncbi:MAG: hypothetical protein IKP76_02675 [Bacilli bacterium]|nr:hypothetical protein [Bacilli bacterium]
MRELSLLQIIKNTVTAMSHSNVFVLILFELAILVISLVFSKFINKRLIKLVSSLASIVVLVFYSINYVDTLFVFIDNVSTKLMEFIFFPTTLEFMITMIISFIIMGITLLNKKENTIVKIINVIIPVIISFIFLCIIENINTMNISFNEFSVFTDPTLMSLNEAAIALFVAWLISLAIYKVDVLLINRVNSKKVVEHNVLQVEEIRIPAIQESSSLITVNTKVFEEEEEIEMPRLKNSLL